MMVAMYRIVTRSRTSSAGRGSPFVVLKKDKQYTFKGKSKRFSDDGFASDRGLPEFVAYKPHDPNQWVYPAGAPWRPLDVQRREEEQATVATPRSSSCSLTIRGCTSARRRPCPAPSPDGGRSLPDFNREPAELSVVA